MSNHEVATCATCRRYRKVFSRSPNGRPVCLDCSQSPAKQHTCPTCQQAVPGGGRGRCYQCCLDARREKRIRLNLELLETDWLRDVLFSFAHSLPIRTSPHAIKRIDACAVLLSELDQRNLRPGDVSQALLFSLWGRDGLRRHGRVIEHLCRHVGIAWDPEPLQALTENATLDRMFAAIVDSPWKEDIERYRCHLCARTTKSGEPLKLPTIKAYIRSAIGLISHAHLASLSELSATHVDLFLKDRPGHAASLHPLIRFIGGSHEDALRAVCDRVSHADQLAHERAVLKESRRLISALNGTNSRRQALILISRLLAHLFGIPISSVLTLQWHHVTIDTTQCSLTLDGTVYVLSDPLKSAIMKWLTPDPNSRFVFSGRNFLQPIHPSTVQYHVKKLAHALSERG